MGWSRQITKISTYLLRILSDDILIMSMPNFIHVCRRSSVIKIDIVGETSFFFFFCYQYNVHVYFCLCAGGLLGYKKIFSANEKESAFCDDAM